MPLNIQLRDEAGNLGSQIVGDTVLAKLIPAVSDRSSDLLRFVDPYGDTVFNGLQAGVFAAELRSLAAVLTDEAEREAIESIVDLADECANDVHAYLWFVGD